MRILAEFSHPAQVHKFKNVFYQLMNKGHQVLILSRNKDIMVNLLEEYGFQHICLSSAKSGLKRMAGELLIREFRVLRETFRYKPDIIISAHSVAITHAGFLLRIPRIVHDDTEHARLQQCLYMPFATHVITSSVYKRSWGKKQIKINSLEPLAYLHPDYFTPDLEIPKKYGIDVSKPYAIVRFVAWKAAHDIGFKEQSLLERKRMINRLLDGGVDKVVISCEVGIEEFQQENIIQIEPKDIHHILAFSKLCLSEGGSVANEAAVLGIPTVLINPLQAGIFDELERYGLLERAQTYEDAVDKSLEILNSSCSTQRWQQARKKLLADKVDMTKSITNIILSFAKQ